MPWVHCPSPLWLMKIDKGYFTFYNIIIHSFLKDWWSIWYLHMWESAFSLFPYQNLLLDDLWAHWYSLWNDIVGSGLEDASRLYRWIPIGRQYLGMLSTFSDWTLLVLEFSFIKTSRDFYALKTLTYTNRTNKGIMLKAENINQFITVRNKQTSHWWSLLPW